MNQEVSVSPTTLNNSSLALLPAHCLCLGITAGHDGNARPVQSDTTICP
jgi:hypothetical protein